MTTEAACLEHGSPIYKPDELQIFCAGGNPGRASAGAVGMIGNGADALLSLGICGGLDPSLSTGDIVIAESVVAPDGNVFAATGPWGDQMARSLEAEFHVVRGRIATVERISATPSQKARLRQRTDAIAVDMESSGCAASANKAGVPFLSVRVIADGAHRTIPVSARAGLSPDGTVRHFAVLAALTARPWDLPALLRLGRDSKVALRRLRSVTARDLRPVGLVE